MRVRYDGAKRDEYVPRDRMPLRFAIVEWNYKLGADEDETAQKMLTKMFNIGWEYDGYDDCAYFRVTDKDEYKAFMMDWNDAKKELREEKR